MRVFLACELQLVMWVGVLLTTPTVDCLVVSIARNLVADG